MEIVIELHKQKLSMRAISRATGLGLSKIKLVLFKAGLYQPKHKNCNAIGEPVCPRCGKANPPADTTNGTLCRDCKTQKDRKFTLKNRKIDEAGYKRLLDLQNGQCAICGRAADGRRLAIDHKHTTGEIRGLLCNSCNMALGLLQDNPDIVATAHRYLTENGLKSRSKSKCEH